MLADLLSFYAPLAVIVERILAAIAGIMVYRDAGGRPEQTYYLHPLWWGLAVFIAGPILGVVGYWLIHHSGLGAGRDAAETR